MKINGAVSFFFFHEIDFTKKIILWEKFVKTLTIKTEHLKFEKIQTFPKYNIFLHDIF